MTARSLAVVGVSVAVQTILRAQGGRCLWISNSIAIVDGFTLRDGNGGLEGGGGVFLVGATVQNCIIESCIAYQEGQLGPGGGVLMSGGMLSNSIVSTGLLAPLTRNGAVYCTGGGVIEACEIKNTFAAGNGGGVNLENSQLRNTVVSGNRAGNGGGVYALLGGGIYLRGGNLLNCTVTENLIGGGAGGGINEEWMADPQGLDGNPRIINGTVDLGGWEAPLTDTDADGVPDRRDSCPNTPAGSVVNADGCSIAQLCPCEGPWRDHDDYVSCVRDREWEFYGDGLITVDQRQEFLRTAAQSDCGK